MEGINYFEPIPGKRYYVVYPHRELPPEIVEVICCTLTSAVVSIIASEFDENNNVDTPGVLHYHDPNEERTSVIGLFDGTEWNEV
jgi:hypothetical protein